MPGSITGRKSVINYYNLKGSYDWPPTVWLGSVKTFTTQTFGTCLSTDIICWPHRKVSVEICPALGRHSVLGKVAREDFYFLSVESNFRVFKKCSFYKESVLWYQFSSAQLLSCVQIFVTPWIAAHQASLSITNSQSSLRLASIESVMPSSHLILCRPLLLLPPIPPSIRVFSNESTLHMRWPKCCSFSFSIIPSKEIPGLISFRMDWLDLL